MALQFAISPDFPPEHIPGWYIFNTWLQRELDSAIHLQLYDNFGDLREAIHADRLDLVYANPFDASLLVREKHFMPLARADNLQDEAVVLTADHHPARHIEDLRPGTVIAATDVPDIEMMGMIMIEPADLNRDNTQRITCDNYVMVAKQLLNDEADIGFFLAEAFDNLSDLVKNQLRPLVRSQIQVIHHSLMAGPALQERHATLQQLLTTMDTSEKGQGVLDALKIHRWSPLAQEDSEFMIDLMDTLMIS